MNILIVCLQYETDYSLRRKEDLIKILDNSSVHWSEKVQNYFKERNWSGIFLSQYSPELAPIELFFGILKKRILARQADEVINLDKDSGRQAIEEVVRSIDRTTIAKIWGHFISELKQIEERISSILNKIE